MFLSWHWGMHQDYLVPTVLPTLHTKRFALRYIDHIFFPTSWKHHDPCDEYLNNAMPTTPVAMADLVKKGVEPQMTLRVWQLTFTTMLMIHSFQIYTTMRASSDAATNMIRMLSSQALYGENRASHCWRIRGSSTWPISWDWQLLIRN